MRVLQLCLRVPFPPTDGAAIAMNSITRGLVKNNVEVTIFALNTPKHFVEVSKIPKSFINDINFKAVDINTNIYPLDALLSVLTPGHSYNISRFYSKKVESELIKILNEQNFDVVVFESLFVSPYLQTVVKHSKAKCILRSHNIEFSIWEELAKNEKNSIKKIYLKHLAKRLKKYELTVSNKFDGIVCISDNDLMNYKKLGINPPMQTIICGLDDSYFKLSNTPKNINTIYNIGSMDWRPNLEGIKWFLEKIWPKIHKQAPEIECKLAGRKMPTELLQLNLPNVTINEFIPDAIRFQTENNVLIVPLLSGGGIRIKIIEALAMGKVIVTTSKGAEGLNLEHLKNCLIADNEDDFANWVIESVRNNQLAKNLSAEAKQYASLYLSDKALGEKLVTFVKSI